MLTLLRPAVFAAVAALALVPRTARPDPLSAKNQALLVVKVLGFDKDLERRATGSAVIAVAAAPGDVRGEARRDAIVAELKLLSREARARGLAIEARPVSWGQADGLARAAAVVVVGSLAEKADEVVKLTRAKQVLSIGEDASAVERGLAVAVFARAQKAVIAASLLTARQEGVTFESAFLRTAELVEE